jgi:hypothetical protein
MGVFWAQGSHFLQHVPQVIEGMAQRNWKDEAAERALAMDLWDLNPCL